MNTCSVCAHPQLAAIEGALRGGMSRAEVGRQFGLSRPAVSRHASRDLRSKSAPKTLPRQETPLRALPEPSGDGSDAPMDPLEALIALQTARTQESGSPQQARELRLSLQALDQRRAATPLPPDLAANPDWQQVRAALARHASQFREVMAETGVREAIRATDPAAAMADAFGLEPAGYQADYLREDGNILVVKGRQTGFSTAASAKAIFVARNIPGSLSVIVSPSQKQSQELGIRAKAGLRNLERLPLEQDSAAAIQLVNGSRILSLPGTATSLRGYAATLLIIDESAYVERETYVAARALVAATGGQVIIQSTAAGAAGWFYELAMDAEASWQTMAVPSSEAPWISEEYLAAELREMGPAAFANEYGAEFISPGSGGYFDPGRLREMVVPAEQSMFERMKGAAK